ncbi:Shiga toxin A subunit [Salmonella enterica subsp. enterica]|uniref:Shiga toxin A subunit n=1 Tax=Salmonella enterica I TaxID=59201 RepID=A0A379WZ88_SALET|nr:Shiga toxin A subunit [Salmonella enterica subsp. enterica]
MKKIRPKIKVAILDKKSYFDSYYENQVKSIVAKIYLY